MTNSADKRDRIHSELLQKALAAGEQALDELTLEGPEYWAFCYVTVQPATSSFGRFLLRTVGHRAHGERGVWISAPSECRPHYIASSTWTRAVASVFQEAGIRASTWSWDDSGPETETQASLTAQADGSTKQPGGRRYLETEGPRGAGGAWERKKRRTTPAPYPHFGASADASQFPAVAPGVKEPLLGVAPGSVRPRVRHLRCNAGSPNRWWKHQGHRGDCHPWRFLRYLKGLAPEQPRRSPPGGRRRGGYILGLTTRE